MLELSCNKTLSITISIVLLLYEARSGVVVKALRYKPAGHGFDS